MLSDATAVKNVGKLLSRPSEQHLDNFAREVATYENNSERFQLKNRNFGRQFAHIYAERLQTMRGTVGSAAHKKWGRDVPIRKLFELNSDEECIVIGTLFKHMELKPNILKEISKEHHLTPQPLRSRYADDSDELVLEDELQRILLVGDIDLHQFVTGVVIAVYGMEPGDDKGKFHIKDYCFQPVPKQISRPVLENDCYVAIVSGFDVGSKVEDFLSLQLMVDFLSGQLGDPGQQEANAKVVRMIVAGNLMSECTQSKEQLSKAKYLSKHESAGTVEAVKTVDDVLVQIAASMDIDLMPGEFDPANHVLPQQPLHKCMFPQAMMYPTIQSVTNPYDCSIAGVRFLGTSGQNVTDIYRYSRLENPLEILENTVLWGHIAPTAPDTLGCYPFYNEDPFIITDLPHVYFVGNQRQFQSKILRGSHGQEVLLVTVPRFSTTNTCVLVNLKSLECSPLVFHSTLSTSSPAVSPDVEK